MAENEATQPTETMAPRRNDNGKAASPSSSSLEALLSGNAAISLEKLVGVLEAEPNAAKFLHPSPDGKNVYAIHWALQNREILLSRGLTEDELLVFCKQLIFMNPPALLLDAVQQREVMELSLTNYYGLQILEPVVEWVVQIYDRDAEARQLSHASRSEQQSIFKSAYGLRKNKRSCISNSLLISESKQHGSVWNSTLFDVGGNNTSETLLRVDMSFPEFVVPLSEDVDFLLRLFSGVIDDGDSDDGLVALADANIEEPSLDTVIGRLVMGFAAVPTFLKTLLFCERTDVDRVQHLSFVRYIMLEKESVGNWLTPLLKERPSKGIRYLNVLSRFLSDDIYGLIEVHSESLRTKLEGRDQVVPARKNLVQEKRDELLSHVMINHFVPMILVISCSEKLQSQAAEIRLIQHLVDRYFAKLRFPLSLVFYDLMFHFLLNISFQVTVMSFLLNYEEYTLVAASQVAAFSAVYFLLREGVQLLSLAGDWHSFKSNILFSPWNWCDWASIVFTIIATVMIDQEFDAAASDDQEISSRVRKFTAGATFFQLLHFIGFVRKANEFIAVLITSIVEVIYNLRWFLVILGLVLVSFSQIFIAVLSGEIPDSIAVLSGEIPSSIAVLSGEVPISPCIDGKHNTSPFCNAEHHYKLAYEMMLGDWDSEESFSKSEFSYLLFVIFTFFVTIIMMNILIAIACDSYAEAKEQGPHIFRVERIGMCAEISNIQKHLRRSVFTDRIYFVTSVGLAVVMFGASIYSSISSLQTLPGGDQYVIPLEVVLLISLGFMLCLLLTAWGVFLVTAREGGEEQKQDAASSCLAQLSAKYFHVIADIIAPLSRAYIGGKIELNENYRDDENKASVTEEKKIGAQINELKKEVAMLTASMSILLEGHSPS